MRPAQAERPILRQTPAAPRLTRVALESRDRRITRAARPRTGARRAMRRANRVRLQPPWPRPQRAPL